MSSVLRRRVSPAALLAQGVAAAARDPRLQFSGEISVGNIVTALAVLVSAAGLAYTWRRDIALREREYADQVKTAAALTLAKLERAREITLHFFDLFSTCFVHASAMLAEGRSPRSITDYVWIKAQETAAECSKRLLDEEIELAYVDLYAYDDEIYRQFVDARQQQQLVWDRIYYETRLMMQEDIFAFEPSAQGLGSQLRQTCTDLAKELRAETDGVLRPLRKRLQKWIYADPRDIVKRKVNLGYDLAASDAEILLPGYAGRTVLAFARGAMRGALPPECARRLDRPHSTLRAALEQFDGTGHRIGIAVGRLAARPGSAARQARLAELLRPFRLDQRPVICAATDQILDLTSKEHLATAFPQGGTRTGGPIADAIEKSRAVS